MNTHQSSKTRRAERAIPRALPGTDREPSSARSTSEIRKVHDKVVTTLRGYCHCELRTARGAALVFCVSLAALVLAGCTSPIGADRVSTRMAYEQVDANALRTGKPGDDTQFQLHRYDLDRLAARHPDEAVRQLHQKALAAGDRDSLFALAELSYLAGERIRRSVKSGETRDARDYYLGSAVYAWLFLFGEGKEALPNPFDRRFREACDFYNYSLGLALGEFRGTNAIIRAEARRARLPVGEIELQLSQTGLTSNLGQFEELLAADKFRVRGLSVRNRDAGLGAPVIGVQPAHPKLKLRPARPLTVLLRLRGSLADLAAGKGVGALEFYGTETATINVGQAKVPLESDLTAYRAYSLNQSKIWSLGSLQFLAPSEHMPSQLILHQPFEPDRIPVVFVHGTFSSPVTWAEMANSLIADPVLRQRYQLWTFMYGSGRPLVYSVADLRAALTDEVRKFDPEGTNAALHQMVVIGHSQGGLLTKGTAITTGDTIWKLVSTNRLEKLMISDADRKEYRRLLFLEPLPFVRRVIFIATPHRGSYLSGSFARRWAQRLVSLPGNMVTRTKDVMSLAKGSETGKFLQGRMPTSLDSMSPKNPALLGMAGIPVLPPIKANSIIAVKGNGDYHQGKDGLVKYTSAHVDYAESEFIVRNFHTCLDNPATIEEVRRILLEHLADQPKSGTAGR
jgi:pimeloyl-ACP methyl ester carboxylesterase